MSRMWFFGFLLVSAIATVKTALVLNFALPAQPFDIKITSGLFGLFFGLTTVVALICVRQMQAMVERQRKEKLAPGASEPAAKETVILRHATDWGLSQAEADVAIFVAKGFSNHEIAEMRGCAIATVKSQLGRIYKKSGLESRYQLIAFVTDEVCDMANVKVEPANQIQTQKVLPLVTRTRKVA